MLLQLYRKDWRKAGESAYALIGEGQSYGQIEAHIALAIRMHGRLTGDYPRAIKALERWAAVSWEDNEPVLEGQLDGGIGVAGLADMLMASGQKERARALLEELLANAEFQITRYGRGEIWLNDGRAIAYALLGRPDEAMATLQRQESLGFLSHIWRITLERRAGIRFIEGTQGFSGAAGKGPRQQRGANAKSSCACVRKATCRTAADPRSGCSRPWLAHGVGREDLVSHRIPEHVEPLPAAEAVAPALGMLAFRVRAEKEVMRPLLVARTCRRPRDMRLAAVREFRLVAQSAPGAFDPEHAL